MYIGPMHVCHVFEDDDRSSQLKYCIPFRLVALLWPMLPAVGKHVLFVYHTNTIHQKQKSCPKNLHFKHECNDYYKIQVARKGENPVEESGFVKSLLTISILASFLFYSIHGSFRALF